MVVHPYIRLCAMYFFQIARFLHNTKLHPIMPVQPSVNLSPSLSGGAKISDPVVQGPVSVAFDITSSFSLSPPPFFYCHHKVYLTSLGVFFFFLNFLREPRRRPNWFLPCSVKIKLATSVYSRCCTVVLQLLQTREHADPSRMEACFLRPPPGCERNEKRKESKERERGRERKRKRGERGRVSESQHVGVDRLAPPCHNSNPQSRSKKFCTQAIFETLSGVVRRDCAFQVRVRE